jgi:hypothetical protein
MSDSDVDLVEVGDATSLPPTPGAPAAAAAVQPGKSAPRALSVETGGRPAKSSGGGGAGGSDSRKGGGDESHAAAGSTPPQPVSPGTGLGRHTLFAAFALPLALAIGAAAVSASSTAALGGCRAELAGEREQLARVTAQLGALRTDGSRASAAEEQLKAREEELQVCGGIKDR